MAGTGRRGLLVVWLTDVPWVRFLPRCVGNGRSVGYAAVPFDLFCVLYVYAA